jgi:hypothetical protein
MTPSNPTTPSNTTQRLIEMLLDRDAAGQRKYNHTLDRTDLLCEDWAQHAIEESLDRAGYLMRVAQAAAELRDENIRLAEENLRLRSMLQPILELARTLEVQPPASARLPETAGIVPETAGINTEKLSEFTEAPVLNILTNVKMLSQVPPISEPMPVAPAVVAPTTPTPSAPIGMTAREIAVATGYHKDSVNNWGRAGLLPEPVPGTGGHPRNPPRYVVDMDELLEKVKARQEAAKNSMSGKARERSAAKPEQAHLAAPPEPTFDINEEGKLSQIDQGKSTYRLIKLFYLARHTTDSRYLWDSQPNRECDPGWEVVEEWRCNGLGRWESTPEIPGMVGTGNGVTKGAGAYKVPVLG